MTFGVEGIGGGIWVSVVVVGVEGIGGGIWVIVVVVGVEGIGGGIWVMVVDHLLLSLFDRRLILSCLSYFRVAGHRISVEHAGRAPSNTFGASHAFSSLPVASVQRVVIGCQ